MSHEEVRIKRIAFVKEMLKDKKSPEQIIIRLGKEGIGRRTAVDYIQCAK